MIVDYDEDDKFISNIKNINNINIEENQIENKIDQIIEDNTLEFGERVRERDIINTNLNENKNKYEEEARDNNIEDENLNNDDKKESHKKERSGFTRLPLTKIKNIMKLDGEVKLCQKNAYYVMGKLTELFLQELAKNSHSVAKISKRKTMNLEDIACAVKSIEKYNFIDVNSIFNVETVEDLKAKEERFEKKIRQAEIKVDKKDKKETKIEKVSKKKSISAGNMKIDNMFIITKENKDDKENN